MLTKTRDMVNADRASLFLVDRKRKELWSKIADNTPEIRVKLGAGIVGAVATMGKTLNVPDAYRDPRFNKKIDMATGYRTRQILCLPIKNQRSQVIGVVQCINKKRGGQVFTMDDEERLSELARIGFEANNRAENIGARRLHTVLEKLLEEISFHAPEKGGSTISVDGEYVKGTLTDFYQREDLSRYIL